MYTNTFLKVSEQIKQAFFDSVKRCLRPGGRLILRDMTTDNRLVRWFVNIIELPLANMIGHGDVKLATRETVEECCKNPGCAEYFKPDHCDEEIIQKSFAERKIYLLCR